MHGLYYKSDSAWIYYFRRDYSIGYGENITMDWSDLMSAHLNTEPDKPDKVTPVEGCVACICWCVAPVLIVVLINAIVWYVKGGI